MPGTNPKTSNFPWAALELFIHDADAKLHELTSKASQATEESTLAIYFALKDLDESWEKTQAKLLNQVDRLKELEDLAHREADTVKVKAHLAKADAVDAAERVRERLQKIERRLHTFKVKTESDAARALHRMSSACGALSSRLSRQADRL